MLKSKKNSVFLLVFGSILAVYIASAVKVDELREKLDPSQSISALMVQPEVLEIASGEFRSVLADYLLLKASVFLGGRWETKDSDMKAVYTLFKQSINLDPYFFQTCYYVQAFLAWRGEMVRQAIELLKISNEFRYWDWQPGYFIGFDYFYFLKNNQEAAKYLMESGKIPGAPSLVSLLASRMALKSGQTETSIAFLQTMYGRAKDEKTKRLLEGRIKAHTGVLVLEKAIKLYRQKYGNRPGSLDDLVSIGILSELPKNPYTSSYFYDLENGRVFFDRR